MSVAMIDDQAESEIDQVAVDKTILQRVASGEKEAVDDCVGQYGQLIWSLAKRFCASAADAEDACQDIFIDLWRNARRFDPTKAKEVTFVAMVARRRLIDRYRRKAAPETVDVRVLDAVPVDNESGAVLDDVASQAAGCFKNLTAVQQMVLGLSIHDGVSHGGISTKLKIPLGTVKSYARRGLLQLRECMKGKSALLGSGGAE